MNISLPSNTIYIICSTRLNQSQELRYVPVVSVISNKNALTIASASDLMDVQKKYSKLISRMCVGGYEPMIVPVTLEKYIEISNILKEEKSKVLSSYNEIESGYKLMMQALGDTDTEIAEAELEEELCSTCLNTIVSNRCCIALTPNGDIVNNEEYLPLNGILDLLEKAIEDDDIDGLLFDGDEEEDTGCWFEDDDDEDDEGDE